jgi:LysR family transcriptional regulator for bpeEF and oprC
MDRILWMSTFARVVEAGSFSAVARELRTAQPNVSRHVAALERHLGTRLLHRSTRRLTLTPEGERYYGDARRVLDTLEEAEANARGKDMPRGLLRVSCPTLLGRSHVLPHLKTILNLYPEMEIDLQISDRFIDLIEEGVDLAIRIGVLKDSALKARASDSPGVSALPETNISPPMVCRDFRRIYGATSVSSTPSRRARACGNFVTGR